MRRVLAATVLAGSAVAVGLLGFACGLDAVGSVGGAAQADGGPTASDALAPAPPIGIDASQECAGSACGLDVPPGWAVVAVVAGGAACPAGAAGTDVLERPEAGAQACTCTDCTITQPPPCNDGNDNPKFDTSDSPQCNATSPVPFPGNKGACTPVPVFVNGAGIKHLEIPNPPPSVAGAGKCTVNANPSPSAVVSEAARVCVPPACSDACDAPGAKTCLLASGDVACPASAPDKHVVGTGVDLSCGCSCDVTVAGCTGSATFYSDTGCATKLAEQDASACAPFPTGVAAYRWTGVAVGAACQAVPDAGVALAGVSTLCCR